MFNVGIGDVGFGNALPLYDVQSHEPSNPVAVKGRGAKYISEVEENRATML